MVSPKRHDFCLHRICGLWRLINQDRFSCYNKDLKLKQFKQDRSLLFFHVVSGCVSIVLETRFVALLSLKCCPYLRCPRWLTITMSTFQLVENREAVCPFLFKSITQKSHTFLLLASHCPKLSHMATPNCKTVWEMWPFFWMTSYS